MGLPRVKRSETLGVAIKERRAALGLSQLDLATEIGVTQGRVSRWEKGQDFPAPEFSAAVAGFLKVDLANYHHLLGLGRIWAYTRNEVS